MHSDAVYQNSNIHSKSILPTAQFYGLKVFCNLKIIILQF